MRRHTIRLAALAAAILILLSACSAPAFLSRSADPDAESGSIAIYRLAANGGTEGSLLRTEAFTPPADSSSELAAVIAAFSSPSEDSSMVCALPSGVSAEGFVLENGVVTLTLSSGFLEVPEMTRTTAAFCAVLTLCQIDGVEAVTILAGGQTVFTGLMPEDALLTAEDNDPYVRRLRLYFSDADGRYLVSEYHTLTLDEDTSPERYVVEELLRGPNNGELMSALPDGTSLISCTTENGVCTVDLSSAFYDNRPATALGERLAVYSIVDSLTALSGIDAVRILVAGEPVDTYVYRSLAEPLTRYEEPIGPASAPKGEFDADLYLALPGLKTITALPFRVNETGFAFRAEAVLTELLNTAEPGYPTLFPASASVTEITVSGTDCMIDLPESFLASMPEESRAAAIMSMAATLCALPEISSVSFTIAGGSAVFNGTDWSGPWSDFNEYEVE